jgi:trehalose synthase
MALREVEIEPLALERLHELIGPDRARAFETIVAAARTALQGRTVWNINSTATGGGVAELLQVLLAYGCGAGVDARWLVIHGDPRFFEITKRLHNNLYGTAGDGGPLGAVERADYEATLQGNSEEVLELIRPSDIVILHDPQPAGLSAAIRRAGAHLVWRCHVGVDTPNECSDRGWAFLRPHLDGADAYVFSCRHFAPRWIPDERLSVIAPSIDAFSAKNVELEPDVVVRLLRSVGLLMRDGDESSVTFVRRDGSHAQVACQVDLLGTGPPPPIDVPLVVQVSRWDALKDMAGVLAGFADRASDSEAHLILAGPQTAGVADDPEADMVLRACLARWSALPRAVQRRVHLASIPMSDTDENATIVNALQRHASVVVQKSLAEGFGLTVTEAMWKSRPVVATAVGGIADQIVRDESGVLLDDPYDLDQYADAVFALLSDPTERRRIGENARRRAFEHFLADRHLEQWAQLFARLDGGAPGD